MIWMVCCNSVPANHQEIRSHAMYALPYRYLSNMAFRLNCPKYYSQLVSGHINVTYSSEYADSFFFLPARHSWILYHMNILLLTHKGIMYFLFMIIWEWISLKQWITIITRRVKHFISCLNNWIILLHTIYAMSGEHRERRLEKLLKLL